VGKAGAVNAAILATQILAGTHPELRAAVRSHRADQARAVLANGDPTA
jgi:5-(carboxyamino)imidazole ribonucleotide mutase